MIFSCFFFKCNKKGLNCNPCKKYKKEFLVALNKLYFHTVVCCYCDWRIQSHHATEADRLMSLFFSRLASTSERCSLEASRQHAEVRCEQRVLYTEYGERGNIFLSIFSCFLILCLCLCRSPLLDNCFCLFICLFVFAQYMSWEIREYEY